jgi:aminoglycoside phosphotransferase (APT) family kinase protein
LKRWFTQYEHTAGDEPDPLVLDLHERLAANIPAEGAGRAGRLLHGDYHIDNVVFDDRHHAIAVLDWELCALGDPLADLAWALMFWTTSADELSVTTSPATLAPGFLSRAQFAERYRASSGLEIDALPYFLAFSHWKLACLIQGSIYRRKAGQSGGLQAGAAADEDNGADSGAERVRALLSAANGLALQAGI